MIDLGKSDIRLIACRRDTGSNDDGKFTGVYEAKASGASSFLVLKYAWTKHGALQESLFASNPAFALDQDGESPCVVLNTAQQDTGPIPATTPEYAACTYQVWGDEA
jgi:hypothetical protein